MTTAMRGRRAIVAADLETIIVVVVVAAVIVAGLVASWSSIVADPLVWFVVLSSMVLCAMLTVRVSSLDPLATVGITSAMIGVLSPGQNILTLLLIWTLGALVGFVIRRRQLLTEVRRVARLLPAATVYILIWHLIAPEPDAPVGAVVAAASAAGVAYLLVGLLVATVTARLRGYSPGQWVRSLRFDLLTLMTALTIVLCLVARGAAMLLQSITTVETEQGMLAVEASLVLAVLGAAAFAVDAFVEAQVSRTRLDGIVEAAAALPWPGDADGAALAQAYARRTVRANEVTIESEPVNSAGAISAPLTLPDASAVHLVARRRPGRPAFIDLDRIALAAVANIASESMRARSVVSNLETESQTDLLTGLANYRGLQSAVETVRSARRPGQGIAAIYIDMDGFKRINDHYGHDAGNHVLRLVSDRMRTVVRPGDVVARVGGDEFLVLLRDIESRELAEAVGDRIHQVVAAPMTIGATSVPIGFSYGISFSDDDEVDPAALIDRADVQMYRARGLRPEGDEDDEQIDIDLPSEVDRALDAGALIVHYQPIVDAGSGLVTAVEALVRCPHPEIGWIPAPLLVREARRLGRLPELTAQVMQRAFADADSIGGTTGPMHVNVDLDEVAGDGFRDLIDGLRATYPHVRLLLELGEDSLNRTTPETVGRLTTMRDTGVQIALDDFGKAHSTMLAIAQLPVDVIKFDRSLVQGIEDAAALQLLASLDRLAKRLRIRVVAEGVETDRERELLMSIGVAEMQGYWFARPMPVEELRSFIATAAAAAFSSWTRPSVLDDLD